MTKIIDKVALAGLYHWAEVEKEAIAAFRENSHKRSSRVCGEGKEVSQ